MTSVTPYHSAIDLNRRSLLKGAAAVAIAASAPGFFGQAAAKAKAEFELSPLPYSYDALAPVIDAETMQLHHGKHHKAYVDALNGALKAYPQLQGQTIEDLLRSLDSVPQEIRTAVKNNGGGHANHQLFWKIIKPGGAKSPSNAIASEINRVFGSVDTFKEKFIEAGTKHFGSGWVFLVTNPDGKDLEIITLPNQDSVLPMNKVALFGNDLWEHAYYLTYRNKRPEYLKAWFEILNWTVVGERLEMIRRGDEKGLGSPA